MIVSANEDKNLPDIMRDFKKFTSRKITASIKEINESRDWLLNKFSFAAKINAKSEEFKFWQDGYHPISVETNLFKEQKLDYIHFNPVEAGFVYEPEHYVYSSAINYSGGLGLIEVVYLD